MSDSTSTQPETQAMTSAQADVPSDVRVDVPSAAEQMAAAQQVQMVLFLAAWKRLAAGVVLLTVLPAAAFALAMDATGDHALTGMLSWSVAAAIAVALSLLVPEASVEEIAEQFVRQGDLAEQRGGSFADRFAAAQQEARRRAIEVPTSVSDPDRCDLCETDEVLQGRG